MVFYTSSYLSYNWSVLKTKTQVLEFNMEFPSPWSIWVISEHRSLNSPRLRLGVVHDTTGTSSASLSLQVGWSPESTGRKVWRYLLSCSGFPPSPSSSLLSCGCQRNIMGPYIHDTLDNIASTERSARDSHARCGRRHDGVGRQQFRHKQQPNSNLQQSANNQQWVLILCSVSWLVHYYHYC